MKFTKFSKDRKRIFCQELDSGMDIAMRLDPFNII